MSLAKSSTCGAGKRNDSVRSSRSALLTLLAVARSDPVHSGGLPQQEARNSTALGGAHSALTPPQAFTQIWVGVTIPAIMPRPRTPSGRLGPLKFITLGVAATIQMVRLSHR